MTEERNQKIADARRVLDFLEANEELAVPEFRFDSYPPDSPQNLANALNAINDKCEFEARPDYSIFRLTKKFGTASLTFTFGKKLIGIDDESLAIPPAMFGTKLTDEPVGGLTPCPHGVSQLFYCNDCHGTNIPRCEHNVMPIDCHAPTCDARIRYYADAENAYPSDKGAPRKPKRIRITAEGSGFGVGSAWYIHSAEPPYYKISEDERVPFSQCEVIEWEPKLPSEIEILAWQPPDAWYANRSGCRFKVTGERPQSFDSFAAWIVDDNGQARMVRKEDCADVDEIPF